jgi:uracil-DNA glycosylase
VSERIPDEWREAIGDRLSPEQLDKVERLANVEFDEGKPVYPPVGSRFAALRLTSPDAVRVVILGQDPYHEHDQAHGLAFSTLASKWPPSLRNIIWEWHADTGMPCPSSGSLQPWASRGVLLLNTALTVRYGIANSHRRWWQPFTSAIIEAVNSREGPVAFLLWGASAIKKRELVVARHVVVPSSHPSPLSADRPCGEAPAFIGSRPFSRANVELAKRGAVPIDWRLVPE